MKQLALVLLAVTLPFIVALHRFAVNYGYRGLSRQDAIDDAGHVGIVIAVAVIVVLFWYNVGLIIAGHR
jgi:hypothetical protein